jgi:phosphoribosyl-dephospho-CoA transferase
MFARHDLVWLSVRGWAQALTCAPSQATAVLQAWRRAGWPAIVRRADAGQAADQLSVGFAFPPHADGTKLRVAGRIDCGEVEKHMPPLTLAGALDGVPVRWQPALASLEQEACALGLALSVYGSVALQALTGQPYLKEQSDIDLLLKPVERAQLLRVLDLLDSYASVLPLDGEVVFPDGRAVAWKELASGLDGGTGGRVLAKEMGRVSLAKVDDLLATMEEATCSS